MANLQIKSFNLRVYGIYIDAKQQVLITDEFRLGMRMTKFPGGGLKPGEGTRDCLRRECREELGQDAEVLQHFYTTDYFQPTYLLDEPQQLISIYYLMRPLAPEKIRISKKPFDFEDQEGAQSFRFLPAADLTEEQFTLPVDKKVALMISEKVRRRD